MTTLHQLALRDALRASKSWREMSLAALDQLHAAQQTIKQQQRQIAEMREERTMLARTVFGREA